MNILLHAFYKVFFLFLFCFHFFSFAVEKETDFKNTSFDNKVYSDADSLNFNHKNNVLEWKGNVIFLLGDVFISAERIQFLKNEDLVVAEGHVKIIYKNQKAIASRVVFDNSASQVRMDNAEIFSDPYLQEDQFSTNALGFSKAEIAFDAAKSQRANEIKKELENIREQYTNVRNLLELKPNDAKIKEQTQALIRRYSQLMARYVKTNYQPNVYLESFPEDQRSKILERRSAVEEFRKKNADFTNHLLNFSSISGYIYVSASRIIQKKDKSYLLNDTFITPCRCGDVVPAVYGLSSKNAQIDIGDYITMEGATFDVFSVPFIYFPWMKLSVKEKRETGFIYPGGYASSNSGQALSIPFFLTLGDHADSTLTYQYFTLRGSKFSADSRVSFSQESLSSSLIEGAHDKIHENEWKENKDKLESTVQRKGESKRNLYESFTGDGSADRWYVDSSINVPLNQQSSAKLNAQFVSDNNYLSDYSQSASVNPQTAIIGVSSATKRFLNQEINAEYYGNNFVLSFRGQAQRDLFALHSTDTPNRLPLIEFTLLPNYYFNLPFIYSSGTSFENVSTFGNDKFISVENAPASPSQAAGVVVPTSSPTKTDQDPFIQGQRISTKQNMTFAIPAMFHVGGYVNLQGAGVIYSFPGATSYEANHPYETYMKLDSRVELPFYFSSKIFKKGDSSEYVVKHEFTPYIQSNYIPNVNRSSSFPYTYQLWYAEDNEASQNVFSFGSAYSLHITKTNFILSKENVSRVSNKIDLDVVDTKFLSEIKEFKSQEKFNDENLFKFTTKPTSSQIYESWAKLELDNYYATVRSYEFNQNYLWPGNNVYTSNTLLDFKPLTFYVAKSYNFSAEKTANELNKIAGPNFSSVYIPAKTGDLNFGVIWNLDPIFSASGKTNFVYSEVYKRFNSINSNLQFQLGRGFATEASKQIQYVVNPQNQQNFIKKIETLFSISYKPIEWMQFGMRYGKTEDPSVPASTNLSSGRSYATAYYVNLLNIQDCLDLVLARTKSAGIPEAQATYSVGLNLKFFGHEASFNQVGSYLNRKLQN